MDSCPGASQVIFTPAFILRQIFPRAGLLALTLTAPHPSQMLNSHSSRWPTKPDTKPPVADETRLLHQLHRVLNVGIESGAELRNPVSQGGVRRKDALFCEDIRQITAAHRAYRNCKISKFEFITCIV